MDKFIIQNPVISEKATRLAALGQYVFLVRLNATAPEVKKAVMTIYPAVHVTSTNVIRIPAKPKRYGGHPSFQQEYKKVIVTLRPGEKIDITS